jgi:hypothetical protein
MKTNSQDGHDPHREFMEWVAAVKASSLVDHEVPISNMPPAKAFPPKLALRRG